MTQPERGPRHRPRPSRRSRAAPAPAESLITLRRCLLRHQVISRILQKALHRLLNAIGAITAQRTRTWKWSDGPPLYGAGGRTSVLAAYPAAEAGTLDGVASLLQ